MEIAPHIHWIEGVRANVYACLDGAKVSLIDTGWPSIDWVDKIANYLERLGLTLGHITRILLTHADVDHAGNTAALLAQTDAIVYAGEETKVWLTRGESPPHLPRLAQWYVNHFRRYTAVPAAKILTVKDGDTVPVLGGLKVLATPGHTADHIAYYHPPTGVLFAGDALDTRRERLQCSPSMITISISQAQQSARRLLALSATVIACGHGRPMLDHTVEDIISFQSQLHV